MGKDNNIALLKHQIKKKIIFIIGYSCHFYMKLFESFMKPKKIQKIKDILLPAIKEWIIGER